jgi:TRAP-type C4-dicarboxylate transport system permease small subunit
MRARLTQRIGRAISRIEDALLVLLLTGMVLLAFLQIALRNLAEISIAWGDPMLRILVLWLALAGAIAATRDDNHIRIDLLSRLVPGKLWGIFNFLTNMVSASVCGVVAWHAFRFVRFEQQDGTVAFSGIPTWTLELILPVGFGIMAARFLFNGFSAVKQEHSK